EDLDADVFRTRRLQEARREVAVVAELRVGVVVDDDEVVRAGELDRALEVAVPHDRTGRVVRVVEEEQVRPPKHVRRDRVEIGQEPVLRPERQVMDVCAGEDRARRVGRIPRIRRKADVARVEQRQRHVPDRFLAAERRDDLRAWVELDAEPGLVEVGRRLTELVRAVVGRVLVRYGVAGTGSKRLDHRLRCRQVGVANAEADHVDAGRALLGDLPLELGEQVRRHRVEPAREPHNANSSASSTVQISSAGPVSVASPSCSSTWRSPPARCTVTGLSHHPFATAAALAATALVPEESVSPAPRSQTPTVMSWSPSTRTSWTFVRSAKRSWCSTSGPSRISSARSGRRWMTACGLPTETGVSSTASPSTWIVSGALTSTRPMACSTSLSPRSRATTMRGPTRIRTSSSPVRRASQRAAMRVPLPESSATEPSGFQITTSALSPSVETTSRIPSEPTPKW